jgi:UDP-3-O-[3-hydroxymyristoyl] glucosamine N-acyltransferase
MISAREIFDCPEIGIRAIVGDHAMVATHVSPFDDAGAGAVTFAGSKVINLEAAMSGNRLTGAIIICDARVADMSELGRSCLLVCDNPRLSFMRTVRAFFLPPPPPRGIHPTAIVSSSSRIDLSASIGAYCVVGDHCVIGARSVLRSHVTLYDRVEIGSDVIVNSGTVIGADGFGYERNELGELEKFPHIGGVVIDDHAEIGSNTSIDRGTVGNTWIKTGARIDNQVHIAHNVVVGARSAVIAQAMIGGSVRIGDESWIAPAAVLMNQISIGAKATVGLGAVVTKDVENGQTVMGSPAQDMADFKATRLALRKMIGDDRG